MNKGRFLLRYLVLLAMVLGISYGIHILVRHRMGLLPTGDRLSLSYLINMILAFGIVAALYALRYRMKYQIGFLFIGGSLIKFILFFIFFYPVFTADDTIDRSEFSSFFVPYFLSLLLETYFATSLLRKLEEEGS
jgi:hypothetical protein